MARAANAQSGREDPFAKLRTDSTAWQRVLDFTIQSISSLLVRTSGDTNAQPWTIRLPDAEPQKRLIERQLRTILRARPVQPSDSMFHDLELGPLMIARDTARVVLIIRETRRCPNSSRTVHSGSVDTVLVPRVPRLRTWGAARSLVTEVGDDVAC